MKMVKMVRWIGMNDTKLKGVFQVRGNEIYDR
jgi:hypothetical protein